MASEKKLKIILSALAAVITISSITAYCFTSSSESYFLSGGVRIANAVSLAADAAEFGSEWSAQDPRFKAFMDLTHGNANIIIADNSGKIIFNYAKAYISDAGFFRVIINENTVRDENSETYKVKTAFIANPKGEAVYRLTIANDSNTDGLPLVRTADPNMDQDFSDVLFLRSLPARKAFVFMIYRNDMNVYREIPGTAEYLHAMLEKSSEYISVISTIAVIIFWLLLPVWVYINCKGEKVERIYPVLLTLSTNLFGLCVYLLLRKKDYVCKKCSCRYFYGYRYCPECGNEKTDSPSEIC